MLLGHSREYLHESVLVKARVRHRVRVGDRAKSNIPGGLTRLCKGLVVLVVQVSSLWLRIRQ
jgi:hypothetical protein